MTEDQDERLIQAFERIGEGMGRLYDVMQARFQKDFPPPRTPHEATVTHLQTADEKLREDQGASSEAIEEWLGRREKEFLANEADPLEGNKTRRSKGRRTPPAENKP